jgi:hypothetical protein
MYRNYINLENFNLKLGIIFLKDGTMALPMIFLFLGSGKMALDTWWLHHGGISCDHMVSPKGLSNETQDKLHVTYRLRIAICYRSTRHLPLRDRSPSFRHANEKTK